MNQKNNFEEWVRQTISITERENFLGFTTKSFIELAHTIREKVLHEAEVAVINNTKPSIDSMNAVRAIRKLLKK